MDVLDTPAPFGGVMQNIPIIAIEHPFCENLLNFNVTQLGVELRNGDSKYKFLSGTVGSLRMFRYGQTKLFTLGLNSSTNVIDFYDTDAGSVSFSTTITGGERFAGLYFNKYLLFLAVGAHKPGYYYNGSTFGVLGYTAGTSGKTLQPAGGDVYKQRAYIMQEAEAAYWYSDIKAISGALTYVDLSYEVADNCYLTIIATITLSDNVQTTRYQAFVFSTGEVLFYSGSYPDGSDWSQEGSAQIGSPLSLNGGIQYQGDYLVFCDNGVVSLRDLFLTGSEAASNLSVNARIQKTWTALVQALRVSNGIPVGPFGQYVRGIWDQSNNKIIISFPGYLDNNDALQNGSFFFIFDTILKSWYFHRSFGCGTNQIKDIVSYKNKVLLMCPTPLVAQAGIMVYEKEGATGFTDRNYDDASEVGYDYEIITAPINNNKNFATYNPEVTNFGRPESLPPGKNQHMIGMDVIIETDLYAQTNFSFVQDLGVANTLDQTIENYPTSLQKPFVNAGIEGSYVQGKIDGTTTTGKTVGLTLYGMVVWVEQGDTPR